MIDIASLDFLLSIRIILSLIKTLKGLIKPQQMVTQLNKCVCASVCVVSFWAISQYPNTAIIDVLQILKPIILYIPIFK